jgi:hypothetical protein
MARAIATVHLAVRPVLGGADIAPAATMLKLALLILRDILIGVMLAGIALGIGIPMLMKSGIVSSGGISGFVVIAGTVILAICVMVFRRGGALGRDRKE